MEQGNSKVMGVVIIAVVAIGAFVLLGRMGVNDAMTDMAGDAMEATGEAMIDAAESMDGEVEVEAEASAEATASN